MLVSRLPLNKSVSWAVCAPKGRPHSWTVLPASPPYPPPAPGACGFKDLPGHSLGRNVAPP